MVINQQMKPVIQLILLSLILGLVSCVPASQEKSEDPTMIYYPDFNQNGHQVLYSRQDKLQSDSLYAYFNTANIPMRYLAVMAFGSIKDPNALPRLSEMLKDSSMAVRNAAAYALGQIGDVRAEKPLTDAFINFDSIPGFQMLNATIMEALGKCGSAGTLKLISETSTYMATDTLMLLGQARAIFGFGQRNLFYSNATNKMVSLLVNKGLSAQIRELAAQYLARFDTLDLVEYHSSLFELLANEENVYIRMNLIPAIIQSKHPQSVSLASQILSKSAEDYRVQVNTIRALKYIPYDSAEVILFRHLKTGQPQSMSKVAEFLLENGNANKSGIYFSLIDSIGPEFFETKYTIAAAAARYATPYNRPNQGMIAAFFTKSLSENPPLYHKREIIKAMGHCLECLVPLKNILVNDQEEIMLRSAAAEALGILAGHAHFNAYYRTAATDVKVFIAKYLALSILNTKDGLVAPAATSLSTPAAGLRLFVSDTIQWSRLRDSLSLPAQSEDYIALLKLEKFLNSERYSNDWRPPYNNPIDWEGMRKLSDSTIVVIATNQGDIHIQLLKHIAPATSLSFVKLVNDGFYKDKFFHRVVPNFVIQGGCTRGDGYGSVDFSLRSELPPIHYDEEGYVGMASAGNHTESQQFFITHSPTPHLNGNYTIFGKVTQGMDVVHRIRIGDQIKSVTLIEQPTN